MFFDPTSIRPSPARRRRPGKDILTASANNLYVGVTMKDLEGFDEQLPAELAAREAATARWSKRSTAIGGRYGAQIAAIVAHLEAAIPFATEPMADGAARARSRSTGPARRPTARPTTSPGCRTRRRRSTRSTASSRSTSTRAASRARGKRSSSTSTARRRRRSRRSRAQAQWFEDHMPWDPKYRKAGRAGHHRQRHRRRHRDRRLGADDAGRHQPAERSDDPRALRQQVGVAVERQRGVRQVDAAGVPQRVLVDARGGRARRRSGARSPAS